MSWLTKRDEVIVLARKLTRLNEQRMKVTPFVTPFWAMSMLAAAITDLDEEEGR